MFGSNLVCHPITLTSRVYLHIIVFICEDLPRLTVLSSLLCCAAQEPGQETDGSTCLHLAVLSGQDKLVRLLLVQGAEREATNKVRFCLYV